MEWLLKTFDAEKNPRKKLVLDFFKSLPQDQQQMIILYYEKQVPVKDIAAQHNCSITTAYKKLNTAVFHLKMEFKPETFAKALEILYPDARI